MDVDEVLGAKTYLWRIGHWPPPDKIDPKKWLNGFKPEHHEHALALLDSFIYINLAHAKKLLTSTIHSLSEAVSRPGKTYSDKRKLWNAFLHNAVFSAPTGEIPSPSDSGLMYLRFARQEMGLDDEQILFPADLRNTVEITTPSAIILADDFAGSGEQFRTTWHRKYWSNYPHSIAELTIAHSVPVFYIPLICTDYALQRVANIAPDVAIRPGHVLTDVYTATDPSTVVFPDSLRPSADDFIREASAHAGITANIYGFHNLAVDIAIDESIPDACVGLLWSEEAGWNPLMARR